MSGIHSLQDLGNEITNKLKNNYSLINLSYILDKYDGNDWYDHIRIKDPYNKTNVFYNDLIDIYIITWSKNNESKIHTHPENGCLMKILNGCLIEEKYDDKLKLLKTSALKMNNISYIEGHKILHKIKNEDNISVSLHIYSPPNYRPIYY